MEDQFLLFVGFVSLRPFFLAEIFSPIFSRVESINNNNNNDDNNDDNKNNNIDNDNSNNDDNSSINDDKQAFRATDVKVT